jgi:zinc/manganese transport system permease protein
MPGLSLRMLARVTFDDQAARLVLLAVSTGTLAGALGSWIVLRRQAFLAHASGATAFAGGSVAASLALPVIPVAIVTAAAVSVLTGRAAGRRPEQAQIATGLSLACGLALGVLAVRSGQPQTGTSVLLGSTLLATDADVLTAVAAAVMSVLLMVALGRWWLVGAVHPSGGAGVRAGAPWLARSADFALLLMIGVSAAALLPVAGALLAGTLLVVPASTAQRVAPHPRRLVPLTAAIATAELLAALFLADATDLAPGATAALLAAGVDIAVALAAPLVARTRSSAVLPA